MSEVKAYRIDECARMIEDSEPDDDSWTPWIAAQSELSALREELAELRQQHAEQSCVFCNNSGELLTKVKTLQSNLTAAEQRNAEHESMLRHFASCADVRQVGTLAVSYVAALTNPTEAGASE